MRKKAAAVILAVSLCMGNMAYAEGEASETSTEETLEEKAGGDGSGTAGILSPEEMFTERDYETGYSDYVTVTLRDGGSVAEGSGVSIADNLITIEQEGVYLLTGTLTEGQVAVDAGDSDKVQIVLDNVSVSNGNSAALYVRNADKVFLTTAAGSENTLCTSGEFVQTDENKVSGAIYAAVDLTMNGEGILNVSCETGHGVVTKDDLKITGGTYRITAAKRGMYGKDSVRIAGGEITIESGTDGVHSEHEDAEKGFLYLCGGVLQMTCGNDGFDASGTITVLDGDYTITTNGGSENAAQKTSGYGGFGGGMERFWKGGEGDGAAGTETGTATVETGEATETTETTSDSWKGMKANGSIWITGGSFRMDTADDAVHTNSDLTVSGGSFSISSGDDGMHADAALTIQDGEVDIAKSYEGIEGTTVVISGGRVKVTASDDGLNAAGGNDGSSINGRMGQNGFTGGSSASITISGGEVTVKASGDGIDSNGSLLVSGGTVYVSGPENSGNGALDYEGSGIITGGTVAAVSAAGMNANFGSDSSQGSILCNLSSTQEAGTTVTLSDSDGNVLVSYTPESRYQSVVVSVPELEGNGTYTLTAGTETQTIEMSGLIYGSGEGFGKGGSMMGGRGTMGRKGTMPDGQVPAPGEDGMVPGGEGSIPDDAGMIPGQGGAVPEEGQFPDGEWGIIERGSQLDSL